MKALGIDPGYAKLGAAVVERVPNGYALLDHGQVSTTSDWPEAERFGAIWKLVGGLIRKHHPHLVAIEFQAGVATGKRRDGENDWTTFNTKVDEVVGLLKGACLAYGVRWTLVSPMSVKVDVLGRGSKRATKKEIQDGVRLITGAQLPEHSADGAAIAISGIKRDGLEQRGRVQKGKRPRRPVQQLLNMR